jgi:hypothetical protein
MHAVRRLALAGGMLLVGIASGSVPLISARAQAPERAAGTDAPGPLKLAPRPTTSEVTAEDLRTRLYQFADDSMGGRATGTADHLRATAWIAAELARLGLEPAGDHGTFFQDIPLVSRGFMPGGSITLGSRRFELGTDFGATVAREGIVAVPASAMLVLGGELGAKSTYPDAAAVEGRVVLLRPSARAVSFGLRSLQVGDGSPFAGAAAVVVPAWDQLSASQRRSLAIPALSLRENTTQRPPTFVVSAAMFEALVAAAGRHVALDVRFREGPAPARNVVAVLRGRDPVLRQQYVADGAHSDHEGAAHGPVDHDSLRAARRRLDVDSARAAARRLGPPRLDSIRNGADDDGSGAVAVLEVAEALAALAPHERPRRSVLLLWHAGEELGLVGSGWFSERPTVERDSIVAMINLDMVGRGGAGDIRGGGPRYVQLIGARRLSDDLGDLLDKLNHKRTAPFDFDRSYDANGHRANIYCRSDHARYARFGIPVAFLTTGLHADYHQVSDEAQYIDYDKLAAITGFVRDVTVALGNRTARPRLSRPRPDPAARCRQ